MTPLKQILLCACLVFAATLGWILHQPPAGGPESASPTESESAEITQSPRAAADAPGPAAGAPADRGILPVADKHAEPVVSMPLPDDFLQRILSADEKSVAIPLPGGDTAQGRVSSIRRDENGLLLVQGAITRPEAGHFMFQRQTIRGKAGALAGFIYYDGSETAYQVRPTGENGKPVLVKTTADSVICRAYAAAADEDEIPSTHPTNDPIPPGENGVIQLQSLPGATAVIYLDFNGEERNFEGWGYINAAPSGASNAQIFQVWQGVCEDYQPFQINVTTVRAVYDAAPPGHRIQVVITPTDTASPGYGGVAYVGSFNWTGETVCWSFVLTGKYAVDVISHEVGHTLGLSHDGRTTPYEQYYQGSSGWAPIMGVGYYQPLTQWSKGEYPYASNPQDDLQIISSNNNGVAYRADDHGASFAAAAWMNISSGGAVANEGIIETNTDRDSFRFSTTGGNVTLQIDPTTSPIANLDIKAEILSVTSSLIATIATSNPTNTLGAAFTGLNLAAGDYLLRVSGIGNSGNGYSDYASLGSYTITGTVTGGAHAARFALAENSATGSVAGTVQARASHGGGALAFAFSSGNGEGAFAINPATGQITVANGALLDFEVLSTRWDDPAVFELFVQISDNLDFATETIRVLVELTDSNEPPHFSAPPPVTIPETLPPGTAVATATATDPDRGDFVTYAIVAGNEGGAFAIDPATGVITVAAPLDYQATPAYQLTLRATDQLAPPNSLDAPLAITLVGIPEGFVTGSVIRTFFSGISGTAVADLTDNPRFPDKPNSEVVLSSFDSGVNQGNNYGSTVRGYLIAPATGEYTFWISADETGELLISPDTNPANAVVCASVSGALAPADWTSQPGQQSVAIELTAGGVYYIETRHKESTGNDHVQVAWQGPGMAAREIIPGRWLAPYHQQHAPWAAEQSLTARESATANTLVGRVSFIEPNIGEEVAAYAITSGNEAGLFTIDSASGDIRVAGGAALVAGGQYFLTVSATDGGSPPATGSAAVNIAVTGLDQNLHAWWRLNETSGTFVSDSSGNGRHAYMAGGGAWIPRSATNQALQLNGSNARFEHTDFESLCRSQSFTVAAWVKVPATHASEGVLIQQSDASDYGEPGGYRVCVKADGRVSFSVYGWNADWFDVDDQFRITSPQAIHDGVWHHVACARDGETGRIFIDGVECATGSGTIRMLASESTTEVGYNSESNTAFLDAAVDDVRIYGEALASPQIVKIASVPVFGADPLLGTAAAEDVSYSGTIADAATDPDLGDTLSYSKTDGPAWLAVATDGTLSGMPGNADVGLNVFTVRATDAAGAYAETTMNITVLNVNDQPAFASNPLNGADATEDAAYTGTIADSATDPDLGDTLSFSKTDGPAWLAVATDGALSGMPEAGDVGPNSFMVRVTDTDGLSADAELLIEVHFANQVPVFLSDPIAATDAVSTIPYAGGSMAAHADDPNLPQGDSLTFTKTTGADWLEIAADGTLSGTPLASDLGPNIFTVRVTDEAGAFAEAALQITVTAPPAVISVTATDPDAAETGPDSGAFTITRSAWLVGELTVNFTISGTATNGVDFLEIPGSVIMADGEETATLIVTPEADEFVEGPETVILTLDDGDYEISGEPAAATITDSNHAPSFDGDPLTGADATEDAAYSGTIAAAATDPDLGNTLSFSKTDGPAWLAVATDGTLSGMPGNSDVGLNVFTVRVTDAAGAYAETTLHITVLNVNDSPVFSADPMIGSEAAALADYSGTLAGTAGDPDAGDTLTFSKIDGPQWLVVNEDGSLSGAPAGTDAGINLFVVSVIDSLGAGSTATLQITVHPPPVVSVIASDPTAAETGPETGVFTITRTGSTDGDLTVVFTLKGTASNGVDYAEIPGSVVIPIGEGNVILTVIPAADELIEGTETVALRLTEGPYEPGESSSAFLAIRDSNHAPFFLAAPGVAPAALVGEPYTGESLADHADDPNLDAGDTLRFEKTSGPDWLSIAPGGALSGLPGEPDLGTNLFTVRVTDAAGLTADGTLQITVQVPTPFENWKIAEFGPLAGEPLVAGESADPDRDGLANLLEYAFGTDPDQADAARVEQEMVDIEGAAYMRLTYFINPAGAGISLIVEGANDPTDPDGWSDENLIIEEVTTARLVVRDMVGGPRRFFRLRVTH